MNFRAARQGTDPKEALHQGVNNNNRKPKYLPINTKLYTINY